MDICPKCNKADMQPNFDTLFCVNCGAEVHVTKGLLPARQLSYGPEHEIPAPTVEETVEEPPEVTADGETNDSSTQEDPDLEVRWA